MTSIFFYDKFKIMEIIPKFIALEGGDGSGTTTQLSLLSKHLNETGKPRFFTTFEPTDGHIGRLLRASLKREINVKPQTLAFLFAADRSEHLYGENGIMEHIEKSELVICDRFVLSSLVYQGIEFGDELPETLNAGFGVPELTLFLDIKPETAFERMKNRGELEIYETLDFQVKVREKYLSIISSYRALGARIEVIDAEKSAQEVEKQIWSRISSMPIFNK